MEVFFATGKGGGLVIEAAGRSAPFAGDLRRRSPAALVHGPRRRSEASGAPEAALGE